MNLLRERYRVDLVELQAACEANYARLLRLLPDMREAQGERRVALSQGDLLLGVLLLRVTENCPYTTTLEVRQEHSLPWLPVPRLEVRATAAEPAAAHRRSQPRPARAPRRLFLLRFAEPHRRGRCGVAGLF